MRITINKTKQEMLKEITSDSYQFQFTVRPSKKSLLNDVFGTKQRIVLFKDLFDGFLNDYNDAQKIYELAEELITKNLQRYEVLDVVLPNRYEPGTEDHRRIEHENNTRKKLKNDQLVKILSDFKDIDTLLEQNPSDIENSKSRTLKNSITQTLPRLTAGILGARVDLKNTTLFSLDPVQVDPDRLPRIVRFKLEPYLEIYQNAIEDIEKQFFESLLEDLRQLVELETMGTSAYNFFDILLRKVRYKEFESTKNIDKLVSVYENFKPKENSYINNKRYFDLFCTYNTDIYRSLAYAVHSKITMDGDRIARTKEEALRKIEEIEANREKFGKYLTSSVYVIRSVLNKFVYPVVNKKIKSEKKEGEEEKIQKPLKNMLVFSRVSRDIVRMSDFPNIRSCHRPAGGQYASCATQEAISDGGAILYLFTNQEDISDDQQAMNELENSTSEFMKDLDRSETRKLKYIPENRLRLRTLEIKVFGEKYTEIDNIILHVVSYRIYGDNPISSFRTYCYDYFRDAQKDKIQKLFDYKMREDNGESIKYKFYIYGGGYIEPSDYEEDLNRFIGFELVSSMMNLDQEYPSEAPETDNNYIEQGDHLPTEDEIARRYKKYLRNKLEEEISDDLSYLADQDLFDISINVDVEDTTDYRGGGKKDYTTGHPNPEEIDNYPEYDYAVDVSIDIDISFREYAEQKVAWIEDNIGPLTPKAKDEISRRFRYETEFSDLMTDRYKKLLSSKYIAYNVQYNKINIYKSGMTEYVEDESEEILDTIAEFLALFAEEQIPLDKDGSEKDVYDIVIEDLKSQGISIESQPQQSENDGNLEEIRKYMKKFLK